jgi:hypothetical protein
MKAKTEMKMKPSIGRIVHVHNCTYGPAGTPVAAVVTRVVNEEVINVMAFIDGGPAQALQGISTSSEPGTGDMYWGWPPRD